MSRNPDQVDDLRIAFAQSLRPAPELSVDEWADRYRWLDSRTSSEPGRWRTSRTPYLREIMECMSPHHPAQVVTFMKSSRVGGTECINNAIGAFVHLAPCPIMVVQPTLDDVQEWSKDILDPMIELSPVLKERFADAKSRSSSNTLRHKKFRGGTIFGVGANTPTGFRRRTARVILKDELDGWPGVVGEEGDPSDLADKRATTYPFNRKILNVSTPTVRGHSRIEKLFESSDQRYYHVPCPDCGVLQPLEWAQVQWPEGQPSKAVYVCTECGEHIPETKKGWMLANGCWEVTNPDGSHPGFHISSLYSPWVAWAELAEQWLEVKDDPSRLQVFVNTLLGQTWEEDTAELEGHELLGRREDWGWVDKRSRRPLVPAGANILTAGVDTQDDRFEVAVWAWGARREAWLVDYAVVWGDPSDDETKTDLDAVLDRVYPHATYSGGLRISAACVDSGGHKTQDVYDYCRSRARQKRWAVVGRSGEGRPIWPTTGRLLKRKGGRIRLFTVGVDAAKAWIYSQLKVDVPRRVHLPQADFVDLAWLNQLTAERLRTRYKKGRPIRFWWKPDDAANEALDTFVYALAAMVALESQGRDPGASLAIATRPATDIPKESRKGYLGGGRRKRGKWLSVLPAAA